MVKKNKRQQNIKNKLIAAIAMLLVSSIMMVSSTYAWFTLSTAPEVTGITTSVGANGNLEMALLPESGVTTDIQSTASDGNKAWDERNVTWGNLVDISDTTYYGMDKITLYPAALNLAADGSLAPSPLKIPVYGADGRVQDLDPNKTMTGIFNSGDGNFYPSGTGTQYGVRAIGSASGMTDRQLTYRNAQGAANTAMNLARTKASQSLNTRGSDLANIAMKYGMNTDSATFDGTDVASLRNIINDLKAEDGILDQIETAYIQYILAYGASANSGLDDTAFAAFKGTVSNADTLDDVLTALGTTPPDPISTYIEYYNGENGILNAVNTADEKLQALEAKGDVTFTWAEISEVLTALADPAKMKLNNFTMGEVKEKLGGVVSSITSMGGLFVTMESGAGVYADIADQCGNYTASVNIKKVEYNGVVLENMNARMETKSNETTPYLKQVGTVIVATTPPAGGAAGTMPITDMYGYIVDMAFRTNAADSNLLLQTTPVDRIYEGNETGVTKEDGASGKEISTMGNGSTMTFQATTTDFSNDQVKALMKAVRIVFFTPSGNTILAYAKLDADNAVITADGIVANIYLYTVETNTTYTEAADGTYALVDEKYVLFSELTEEQQQAYQGAKYTATVGSPVETMITEADKAVITSLAQAQAQTVSVLVYLDGNLVTNKDVAATGSTSVTGSMNLQFASSANLTPMNYTDLMEQGENADQGEGAGN